jgi:hypothetical protein
MGVPGFAAEASLYTSHERYRSAALSSPGTFGSVVAQQLCRHLGQSCGGIDLFCCPGLRCTAGLGGRGVCVRGFYHCSPCIDGRQFCCPPPGFGAPCFVRTCIAPY